MKPFRTQPIIYSNVFFIKKYNDGLGSGEAFVRPVRAAWVQSCLTILFLVLTFFCAEYSV